MRNLSIMRRVLPPYAFRRGMLINADGARFVAESTNVITIGSLLLEQPETKANLLLEAKDFRAGVRDLLFSRKVSFLAYALPVIMNLLLGGTRRARSAATGPREARLTSLAYGAIAFAAIDEKDRFVGAAALGLP